MTNDQKINNVEKRKILKVVIIILASLTIILAMLTLIIKLPAFYSLICLVLEIIFTRYRDSLDPKVK